MSSDLSSPKNSPPPSPKKKSMAGIPGTKSTPIIVQSEGSGFNAGNTLTDSNYDVWSQIMEMHIAEREKLVYIRGKKPPPQEDDDGYEKWYADNQKVKRWLLQSMAPEIMKRYLRLSTAREIWSALSTAFYDGSDELQVFSLNQRAFSAKQHGKNLSTYYGELTEIFSELDHRDKAVMTCARDIEIYRKSIQRQRVHIFLAGLDVEFEQIRGEILRKDPIPELEATYALVRRDSVRRATMNSVGDKSDTIAMIARNRAPNRSSNAQPDRTGSNDRSGRISGSDRSGRATGSDRFNRSDRVNRTSGSFESFNHTASSDDRVCTHCNQTGHLKNRCFELVGYPDWWDHNRDPRKKNSTAAVADTKNGENSDTVDKASALVATTGNIGHPNATNDWLWC
ncbi:hypothetical protein ACE6H2_027377 [Prunus campanulata]